MSLLDNHGLMSKFRARSEVGTRVRRHSGSSWKRQQELLRLLPALAEATPDLADNLAKAGLTGRHQLPVITDRVLKLKPLDIEVAHQYVEREDALGALRFIYKPYKQRLPETLPYA